ncbi:MAG TPA: Crp/Fnr family transcriptional regulator [Gammaproteobacteria bacterium]|nr:Crp/Fnr family transcriptional regulator [Gammaproteobacteria bacterium]
MHSRLSGWSDYTMSKNQPYRPVRIRPQPHTECARCNVRPSSLFCEVPESTLPVTQRYRSAQIDVMAGQTLFFEGEKPVYLYTLFSGWVALYQTLQSGKRQILRFCLPGDFIGLQMNGDGVVAYTAQALTDAVFCTFKYDALGDMLNNHSEIGKRLLAMQIRDSNLCQHHLMGAGRKTAEEKIAFLLLELVYRTRMQNPLVECRSENSIAFPLTQEDIADAVGLSKIHVNRVLRDLVQRNYISCDHKCLAILRENELAQIAEFEVSMITTPDFR